MRVSKEAYYLNIAKEVSKRSTCLRRHYGAVIVNNDEIISTGYNGSARGEENCDDRGRCPRMHMEHNSGDYSDCPAVHAEQNAMISASRKDMIGGTLYLYGEDNGHVENGNWVPTTEIQGPSPCPVCMRMLKNSGLVSVVTNWRVFHLRESSSDISTKERNVF